MKRPMRGDRLEQPAGRQRNLVGSKPREIKKWPEDFKGFGSNVRPKKQR